MMALLYAAPLSAEKINWSGRGRLREASAGTIGLWKLLPAGWHHPTCIVDQSYQQVIIRSFILSSARVPSTIYR